MKRKGIIIVIILIVLIYIKFHLFSWGNIKIEVYNGTLSEQEVWIIPQEKHTYLIPPRKKITIKYKTDDMEGYELDLYYYDEEDSLKKVMLSEYVENSYHGKVIVKIKQEENKQIEFEVEDKLGL